MTRSKEEDGRKHCCRRWNGSDGAEREISDCFKTYEEIPKALKRNIWEYAEIRNEIGSEIKDGDVIEKDR